MENVSNCFTLKQWRSSYVSVCQGMRFLLSFPQQLVSLGYSVQFEMRGNDKQTINIYNVFIIKTRHRSVSRDNGKITRKNPLKSFSCDYFTIRNRF